LNFQKHFCFKLSTFSVREAGKRVKTTGNIFHICSKNPTIPTMQKIDLRSDTVTMPDEKMLSAMLSAKAGDMVLNEDPSVSQLEEKTASMFGMQAAAYCPSGTMTNQIAIKVHTRPGDEVICSMQSHIYLYEGGGIAFNSGASVALTDSPDGTFSADEVLARVNPDDPHKAHSRLVVIENSANRGGGKIWNFNEILRIKEVCRENDLSLHLDGARIFNALAETKQTPADYGLVFDSVSVCLSKGLGAPVGSLLIGSSDFIKQAKRVRKVMGGTMRQAGYIAAAGIYALENNIQRLKTDHKNAKSIGEVLRQSKKVKTLMPVETNIIIFELDEGISAENIAGILSEKGVLVNVVDRRTIRMVTHLNVTNEMTGYVCEILRTIV
jgi:threonine aldolase